MVSNISTRPQRHCSETPEGLEEPLSLSLLDQILMALKPISSPVPVGLYPTLAVVMLSIGFMITAFFFIYEATSTRKSRSLPKELAAASFASVFLGFGSLCLLLASGVYV